MTCPDPAGCRVLRPGALGPLRPYVIKAGTEWFNVARHDLVFNSGGGGDSRFAPLFTSAGEVVPYVYLAQNPIAALLETALHDVWGTSSAVQHVDLSGRRLRRIVCTSDLRVVDLRDHRLAGYGFGREELVSSPSEHYACTRRWADHHLKSGIGGKPTTGMIWHSRQTELAAGHARMPMQILLASVEQAARTAVVYDTTGEVGQHLEAPTMYDDLGHGDGLTLVTELCTDLGLHVDF